MPNISNVGAPQAEEDYYNAQEVAQKSVKGYPHLVPGKDEELRVLTNWRELVTDHDSLAKTTALRGRIATGLHALYEAMKPVGPADVLIAQRKAPSGEWSCEVWTKRSFLAWELMLVPHTTQLKDSHLMWNYHAVVTVPKQGRGAHPENMTLALDGRGKGMMAHDGTIGASEHKGSLFWMVTRTTDPDEANLEFDTVTWEQKIQVHLPGPATKKRKLDPVEWAQQELPQFPILVNKQPLEKNTKLAVFIAPKKEKQSGGSKK